MRSLPFAIALLASACAGAVPIVRVDGRACEGVSSAEMRAAIGDPVRARRTVACARGRGELRGMIADLRRQPAGAGRDHVLGLALAAGPSSGWAEAERRLAAAHRAAPEVAAYGLRLGLWLLEDERWAEAVAPLEAAVAAEPDDPGARVALSAALLETGQAARVRAVLTPIAAHHPSRRDVVRARSLLRRASDGSRTMPAQARRMLGEVSALLGSDENAARALDLVQAALAAHPDVAAVHALAALVHARLGNRAEAIAALLRAAELEPEAATHRQRLAESYLDMGQTERARDAFREAVRLDPLALEAHAALGDIAYRQRDFGEAAARFRTVASLDGGEPSTLLKFGRALLAAERWTEAARLYEGLLARGAGSYEAYVRLGEIHVHSRLEARDADEGEAHARRARELLRRALEVRPQDPLVQRLLSDLERASP